MATRQNAGTATDPQTDALVYELYGLTAEAIALVEGHGIPPGSVNGGQPLGSTLLCNH